MQYYLDATCIQTAPFLAPPSNSENRCLFPTDGNGLSVEYTCINKAVTFNPSSWIAITAYNDNSCAEKVSGWVTYACGTCMPLGNGAYYKLTCTQSQAGGTIDYRFANYTSSDCSTGLIYAQSSHLVPSGTCVARNPASNLVEAGDFDTGYYSNATYTLVESPTPPSSPYNGLIKR